MPAVVVVTPGMLRADLTTLPSTFSVMTSALLLTSELQGSPLEGLGLDLVHFQTVDDDDAVVPAAAFAERADFIASFLTFLLRV